MIFLSAAEPGVTVNVFGADFQLEPIVFPDVDIGQILAMENELAKRILQRGDGKIQKIDFDSKRLPGFPAPLDLGGEIPAGSSVVLIRGGGIGDVLMCTPAIRELRKRLPRGVRLTLATFKENESLFAGNPDIDGVTAQPLTLAELLKADYYLEFNDPDSSMTRSLMIDFYLAGVGVSPRDVADKRPFLSGESLYDAAVANHIGRAAAGFKRAVYLNGLASDRLRDLPPMLLSVYPEQFPGTLFILPAAYRRRYADHRMEMPAGANTRYIDTAGSLAGYVTAINCCDAVITTDSSAYHIAAALDKPCVALFGPISARLRAAGYPSVRSLEAGYEGKTCRSPCGKSMFSEFYPGAVAAKPVCPEAVAKQSDFSPCLASLSPARLRSAFEEIVHGTT